MNGIEYILLDIIIFVRYGYKSEYFLTLKQKFGYGFAFRYVFSFVVYKYPSPMVLEKQFM
jgi:hypothetical protein